MSELTHMMEELLHLREDVVGLTELLADHGEALSRIEKAINELPSRPVGEPAPESLEMGDSAECHRMPLSAAERRQKSPVAAIKVTNSGRGEIDETIVDFKPPG